MSIRTTNNNVAKYWAQSTPAHSNNKQYTTDGFNLFSYNLCIGKTINGQKILLDYSASGRYVSQTTSVHVGKARPWCDKLVSLEAAKHGGIIR